MVLEWELNFIGKSHEIPHSSTMFRGKSKFCPWLPKIIQETLCTSVMRVNFSSFPGRFEVVYQWFAHTLSVELVDQNLVKSVD